MTQMSTLIPIFIAWRCATAVYATVVVCQSACPSVCPSQAGAVSKRLNVGLRKERHTIAHKLEY